MKRKDEVIKELRFPIENDRVTKKEEENREFGAKDSQP